MNKHGSKWIRPEKRLRLYKRDGYTCKYCRLTIDEKDQLAIQKQLTLDHVIPRSFFLKKKRASDSGRKLMNHESNLVTACRTCNRIKGDSVDNKV